MQNLSLNLSAMWKIALVSPTKIGLCFAGLMCLLYLSSIQSKSGLLFLIIGIMLGCYVVNAMAAMRGVRRISVKSSSIKGVFEGEPAGFWLTVGNRSRRPVGMLEALWDGATLFKAESIPPLSERRLRAETVFDRRGARRLSGITVQSIFPFGLMRARARIDGEGEILVYPAVYQCEAPGAGGLEPVVGGSRRGGVKARSGFDFAGVRAYSGDAPLRSVHWKSSSKGLGLMVKEFDEELSGRIAILVDSAPLKTSAGKPALDWAARAAASLTLSALGRGDGVDLIDIRSLRVHRSPQLANCGVILEALARLPEASTPLNDEQLVKALLTAPRRSAACVVLTDYDGGILDVMEGVRRPGGVTVCLPEFKPAPSDRLKGMKVIAYGADHISARETGDRSQS